MHRKFISLICASAIAVTALTAPARADEDLGKILTGLAALAIIGIAIENANDNAPVVTQRQTQPYYVPKGQVYSQRVMPPVVVQPRVVQPQVIQPKPLPRKVTRHDLPRSCLKTVRRGQDEFRILGNHCLQNTYRQADRLPQACKVEVRGNQGVKQGYKPKCLRKRGYQLSSR